MTVAQEIGGACIWISVERDQFVNTREGGSMLLRRHESFLL